VTIHHLLLLYQFIPFLIIYDTGIAIKSLIKLIGPGKRDTDLDMANIFISAFLHILITLLICIKLYKIHRQVEKAMNGLSKTRNPFRGTMVILIESAAPLAVSGLATGAVAAVRSSVQVELFGMVLQIVYSTCLVCWGLS
jgi:FtsH-binding integral membrane protein